jgi:hypothetical protein
MIYGSPSANVHANHACGVAAGRPEGACAEPEICLVHPLIQAGLRPILLKPSYVNVLTIP